MIPQQTQGAKKIRLQFEQVMETDYFKKEIKRIRLALGLPELGIVQTKKSYAELFNEAKFPEEMKYSSPIGTPGQVHKYNSETKNLRTELAVTNEQTLASLRGLIFFNELVIQDLGDVCEISDMETELAEFGLNEDFDTSLSAYAHNSHLEEKLSRYPITIRIHAHASQRDVVNFIQKNWKVITSYQKNLASSGTKASIKNSKTQRKKSERDGFIFNNQHLSRKKIATLVRERYGEKEHLDVGHIGKVISIQKKRKEV